MRIDFVDWCHKNGYTRAPSIRNFNTDLKAAGYEVRSSTGNKMHVFGLSKLVKGVTKQKVMDAWEDGVIDIKKMSNL